MGIVAISIVAYLVVAGIGGCLIGRRLARCGTAEGSD